MSRCPTRRKASCFRSPKPTGRPGCCRRRCCVPRSGLDTSWRPRFRSATTRSSRQASTCGSARSPTGCARASCRRACILVGDKLGLQLSMHRIDLTAGTVLERDCVYIVPLLEMTALPRRDSAAANPKSSTGRLDVFARIITDYGTEFDRIRDGYKGPLYAEISPRSFSIVVRTGSRLVQLRIRRGSPIFRDTALRRLHAESPLVETPEDGTLSAQTIRNGLVSTVDVVGQSRYRLGRLQGAPPYPASSMSTGSMLMTRAISGSRSMPGATRATRRGWCSTPTISTSSPRARRSSCRPTTPPRCCPTTRLSAEFRVHYAGFFDPGFGAAEGRRQRQPRRAGSALARSAVS